MVRRYLPNFILTQDEQRETGEMKLMGLRLFKNMVFAHH